jgi:hypothetical protein
MAPMPWRFYAQNPGSRDYGRYPDDLLTSNERRALDLELVRNQSLGLYVVILLRTFLNSCSLAIPGRNRCSLNRRQQPQDWAATSPPKLKVVPSARCLISRVSEFTFFNFV